jgi:hypothetical protein
MEKIYFWSVDQIGNIHLKGTTDLKLIKTILISTSITTLAVLFVLYDIADRGRFYSKHIPADELNEFWSKESDALRKKSFEKNFGFGKYQFPREPTYQIKLYRNSLLTSRLYSRTLNDDHRADILSFFNNPTNFNWSETTWDINEAEYILRFYNKERKEIGKIWMCLDECGMTESEPFSPNMKYGGLSKDGITKIKLILNRILNN